MSLIRFVLAVVALGISFSTRAEMGKGTVQDPVTGKLTNGVTQDWHQGIVFDPKTGNYIITYKDAYGFFNSSVFEPATKITPKLTAQFRLTDQAGLIEYRYTLSNARTSKQGIEEFRVLVSSGIPDDSLTGNWRRVVAPTVTGSNSYVGWFCLERNRTCTVPPGRHQEGFRVTSSDLPGISVAEISGKATFPSALMAERDAPPALEQQIDELISTKDFVPRNVAAPRIRVPTPFDAAVVIGSIESHIDSDLARLELIDPDFAAQLDRLLQAAADAAKLSNRVAVRGDIKDLRKLLREQYRDLDKEDRKGFDRDKDHRDRADNDDSRSRLIDRLAARVLDFDLRYVAMQITDKKGRDKDDYREHQLKH